MNATRFVCAALVACSMGLGSAASAAPLAKPRGNAILVVSGSIANTNDGAVARFDREMLEAMGAVKIVTLTPWYDKPSEFEGVSMRELMQAVGASGTQVLAIALNNYQSEIPLADFESYDVVLAYRRDGIDMPIRDKGPLFIVYPFDTDPLLQSERYYGRSVWQVKELNVR